MRRYWSRFFFGLAFIQIALFGHALETNNTMLFTTSLLSAIFFFTLSIEGEW